ncbi:MAG: helix-turn-helix domain-containing protein [Pseudomonadota bacterium]
MATSARGLATRLANKEKRRQYILAQAAEMIADDGIDSLTLARLAERSDVTVPTIHNLLGKKNELLTVLVEESMAEIMKAGTDRDLSGPIGAVESFVDNLLGLLATNELYYRAAFIAGERLKYFEHQSASGIFARSIEETRNVCRAAVEQGDLEGNIAPDNLAIHLFASQRLARQDWMNGYITLHGYRLQVLEGMFITLCSDASPALKERLLKKISALAALREDTAQ